MQRLDPLPDPSCSSDGAVDSTGYEPAPPALEAGHAAPGARSVARRHPPAPGRWRVGTHESDRGYLRYRGQPRRGARANAAVDDESLKLATVELEAGREALAAAYAMPRIDRNARRFAISEALAKLGLASRALDEVLLRRGGALGDLEP